jgi:hypothetical protein
MNTITFREMVRFGVAPFHTQLSIWSGGTNRAWVRYAPGAIVSAGDRLDFPKPSFTHPGTGGIWGITRLRIEVTRDTPAAPPGNDYVAFTGSNKVLADIAVVRSVNTDQRLDFTKVEIVHNSGGLAQVLGLGGPGGTSTGKRWVYAARGVGSPGTRMGVWKWGNNTTTAGSHIQFNGTPENDNVMRNSTLITFDNTGSTTTIDKIDVAIHPDGAPFDDGTLASTRVGFATISPQRSVPADATLNVNSMTFTINPGPLYITADLGREVGAELTHFNFQDGSSCQIVFITGSSTELTSSEPITFQPDSTNPALLSNAGTLTIPVLTGGTINEIRVTGTPTSGPVRVAKALSLDIVVVQGQNLIISANAIRIG